MNATEKQINFIKMLERDNSEVASKLGIGDFENMTKAQASKFINLLLNCKVVQIGFIGSKLVDKKTGKEVNV